MRASAPPADAASRTRADILVAIAIVALTVAAYVPALGNGIVWDDDDTIFMNPLMRAAGGWSRFWTATTTPDYYPVTSTLEWLLWHAFGDAPFGYHAVNVVLHAATAVVLWRVLRRLAVPGADVAAMLFAVHPVTVPTVAWISELKNILALGLAATALLAYLRWEDERSPRWYAASCTAFVAALLSKTSVVALPPVLLTLAWYRRGRVTTRDVLATAPFFAASALLGLVTVTFQHNALGTSVVRTESMPSRVAAAAWVLWFYLRKDLVPLGLMMIYPRWHVDASDVAAWLPLVALGAAAAAAWWHRASWGRPALAALVVFVLLLAPVLGFVSMTFHQHSLVSDHLQYVAVVVPIAAVVAAVATALRRYEVPPAARTGAAAVAITVLAALTWQRTHVFASTLTLWTDNLARNPSAWGVHQGLGEALYKTGRADEAAEHVREALRLKPDAAQGHMLLGLLLVSKGQLDAAEAEYRRALELLPEYTEAHGNLGNLLVQRGRMDEAMQHLTHAVELEPERADVYVNLGIALATQGRHDAAIAEYMQALRLDANLARAHYNLGASYYALRRYQDAAAEFRETLRIEPTLEPARQALDTVLRAEAAQK